MLRTLAKAMLALLVLAWPLPSTAAPGGGEEAHTLLRKMISVPETIGLDIDDSGKRVAIVREYPDWDQNYFDNEIFEVTDKVEVQLTDRADGGSWHARWQPGGAGIAFLQYREGIGTQLYYKADRDSAEVALTALAQSPRAFEWSPDGRSIALLLSDDAGSRAPDWSKVRLRDDEGGTRHLWLLDVQAVLGRSRPVSNRVDDVALRRLTGGSHFTVGGFFNSGSFTFTPDGTQLLFDRSANSSPRSIDTQDIAAVDICSGEVRMLVERPGVDTRPVVSGDGRYVAFETSAGPYLYYGHDHIGLLDRANGRITLLTKNFAENATLVGFAGDSVIFLAADGMDASLYAAEIATGEITRLETGSLPVEMADISRNGEIASLAASHEHGTELFMTAAYGGTARWSFATDSFFRGRKRPQTKIIRSAADDGVISEGVLYLPDGATQGDAPRPLMVIVHGGPKQTARPQRVHDYVYPVEHWLDRGMAVFFPNYRGSAGYGDAYRAGSVEAFGERPLADILGGIDALIRDDIVDADRIGIAGWSNGGFLAAYAIARSDRFAVASVGAGITDWNLQFSLSDDPNGTAQYLGAMPWEDTATYRDASPISTVGAISAPVLIQHGESDDRVPPANAHALHRALKMLDRRVELSQFDGQGHYFSSPGARLAAAEQNRRWFDELLLGDPQAELSLGDIAQSD